MKKKHWNFSIKIDADEALPKKEVAKQLRILFKSLDGVLDEDIEGAKIRLK